jgi:hypothetical protein
MGIETIAMLGLSAISGIGQMKQAKNEAKTVVREADIAATNRAKQIKAQAGAAKTSFLQSGLLLEGTPQAAIDSIFNTGLEDLNLIRNNANTRAKGIMSSARNNFMSSMITSSGASTMMGDFASGFSSGFSNPNTIMTGATPFSVPQSQVGIAKTISPTSKLPWLN